jgi:hypothetical protein
MYNDIIKKIKFSRFTDDEKYIFSIFDSVKPYYLDDQPNKIYYKLNDKLCFAIISRTIVVAFSTFYNENFNVFDNKKYSILKISKLFFDDIDDIMIGLYISSENIQKLKPLTDG